MARSTAKIPRASAASPRAGSPPATLDVFLRPSPSTRKRAASTTSRTRTKKPKAEAKRKPAFSDHRDLGTLELLDSDADDDDLEIVPSTPARRMHKGKGKAVEQEADMGKGRFQLEEEDWMKLDEVEGGGAARSSAVASSSKWSLPRSGSYDALVSSKASSGEGNEEGFRTQGSSEEQQAAANLRDGTRILEDPTEQDPTDGCEDEDPQEAGAQRGTLDDAEEEDDDDDLQIDGGLTCPVCKLDLEMLPLTNRNAHLNACLESTTPSSIPSTSTSSIQRGRGLLAPLSRLFSRVSAAGRSEPYPSSKPLSSLPNAFTALMSATAETSQWKEADVAAKQKGRRPKGEERKVPFYKWIEGLEITVDAFKYGKIQGCKAYFLSHAHSDHYQNLSSSWKHGPIYCSQTTANLVKLKLNVADEWLHPLPLDQTVQVQGIDVTLIDANHCPGSVLFLFEGPHTDPKSPYTKSPERIFRYLHCGDFRASPQHILHPCMSFPKPSSSSSSSGTSTCNSAATLSASHVLSPSPSLLNRTLKKLDALYLDTTYLAPAYCFPAQELVIAACAQLVKERVVGGDEGALWKADGREGERRGLKGWLKKEEGEVKDLLVEEEGMKMEGEEEAEGMVEMERLPEEEGEDQDEQAWMAAHAMTQEQEGTKDMMTEPPAPTEVTDDLVSGGADNVLNHVNPMLDGEGDEEVKPVVVKAEGIDPLALKNNEDVKFDVKPDIKPDIKPAIKPDVKPRVKERLLVLVGTYSIGKERIVKAIAHALSTKVYCDSRKRELFLAQDDADLHSLLTEDPLEAQVHVGYLSDISRESLQDYLGQYKAPRVAGGFTKLIGLRPTGWTYRSETKDKLPTIARILQMEQQRKFSPAGLYPQRDSTPQCMAFGVPYSEHSSFFELTCFCLSLDYTRIIPTVNVHTPASRNKMREWIDRWAAEKKRRADARLPKIVPYRSEQFW
ncbi:hypothetical protein JCM1841_000868 [Sporobolomyces salmonicolor]